MPTVKNDESHQLLERDVSRASSDGDDDDIEVISTLPSYRQQASSTDRSPGPKWFHHQPGRLHLLLAAPSIFTTKIRSICFSKPSRSIATIIVLFVLVLILFWTWAPSRALPSSPDPEPVDLKGYNPMFSDVLALEAELPQHKEDLPRPEGRNGRYINFSGHTAGPGWNNVVQEQLVETYLAVKSRRAYVSPPHIARDHRPFPEIENLRIPFGTFAYSASTGAPFPGSRDWPGSESIPDDQLIPRAISEEHFHSVCDGRTVDLALKDVHAEMGINWDKDDMKTIVDGWAKKLLSMEESCVNIPGWLFVYFQFGHPRILTLWNELSASPVLANWDWSPLIHAELEKNGFSVPSGTPAALVRKALPPSHPWSWKKPADQTEGSTEVPNKQNTFILPKLAALHIRRGDYKNHCTFLADNNIAWTSWNMLGLYSAPDATPPSGVDPSIYNIYPEYLDQAFPHFSDTRFSPPYTDKGTNADGTTNPEGLTKAELLLPHCWPTLTAIRNKMHAVRDAHPGLEDIYLLTNGNRKWVDALTELLLEDGWKSVRSSLDLELSDAAIAVSQAVDMAIGHWAEVFVGNGWSSMSANVVGFRLAQGHPPDTVRFW